MAAHAERMLDVFKLLQTHAYTIPSKADEVPHILLHAVSSSSFDDVTEYRRRDSGSSARSICRVHLHGYREGWNSGSDIQDKMNPGNADPGIPPGPKETPKTIRDK
eukprot:6430134-Amphidinium_carterae.1